MPSTSTFLHFQDHLELAQHWQWSGAHYEKTSNAWLENMDRHADELKPLFEQVYAQDADAWWQRWRIFLWLVQSYLDLNRDKSGWLVTSCSKRKAYNLITL